MGFIRAGTRFFRPRDYRRVSPEKAFGSVEPSLPSPQLLQLHARSRQPGLPSPQLLQLHARSRQPGTRSFPTLHTPSIMYIYIYYRRRVNTNLLRERIGSPGGAVPMDLLFRAPPEAATQSQAVAVIQQPR